MGAYRQQQTLYGSLLREGTRCRRAANMDSARICWSACSGPHSRETEVSPHGLSRAQSGRWIYYYGFHLSQSKQESGHMAKEALAEKSLGHLLKAVSHLVQLPRHQMWLDYDEEADVLYVHFVDEADSTHSEMREKGVILDYKDNHLVGVTILE